MLNANIVKNALFLTQGHNILLPCRQFFVCVDNRVLQTYTITLSYLPRLKKIIPTPFNGESTSKINDLSKSKQTRMGASINFFFNKSTAS